MDDTEKRIEALKAYTGAEEVEHSFGESFEADGQEWDVLTDSEADEAAEERILESLWAFNKSFLDSYGCIALVPDVHWQTMQETMCEDMNALVDALLGAEAPQLVEDAISTDGRGHFLAGYDGEEVELPGGYYAYRTN